MANEPEDPSARFSSPSFKAANAALIIAVLSTIFCCQPLGIVAIVYAAFALNKQGSGDLHGSAGSAAISKRWSTGAIVIGIVTYVVAFALHFAGVW
ncbi:MAG: CD225/dispanin family protein [Planctomycetes bacterium]|nr:CD225/dispanin family protein [Planctomycetota bacterium]